MRVSRTQAAENRERIVNVASRLFREGGIGATGVDAVMKAAGMTHGGFYGHFQSKDNLVAEACSRSLSRSLEKWSQVAENKSALKALLDHYLSADHRDNPGDGCLIAALAAEAPRSSPEVRKVITEGIRSMLELIESSVPGSDKKTKRANAIHTLTTMVGALIVARAVGDPALSKEILAKALKSLVSTSLSEHSI